MTCGKCPHKLECLVSFGPGGKRIRRQYATCLYIHKHGCKPGEFDMLGARGLKPYCDDCGEFIYHVQGEFIGYSIQPTEDGTKVYCGKCYKQLK